MPTYGLARFLIPSLTKRAKLIAWPLLAALLLSGCSTLTFTDLFVTYSDQMLPMRHAWHQGNATQALANVDPGSKSDTGFYLKQLEIGRLAFLAGREDLSLETLGRVDDYLKEQDRKAEYRISSGLQQVGTAITNDSAITYRIPVYERVMLHHYQALNYLKTKGLESALVEVRRANLLQERALRDNEDEIESVSQKYQSQYKWLKQRYPSQEALIGETKNAFQNAYTFVLSAALYEADGALNDAYIDYKKALEIAPNNLAIARQVARLGRRLGMDDAAQLAGDASPEPFSADQGQLVFLYEQGLIPYRKEISITLPIGSYGQQSFASLSFPVLETRPQQSQPIPAQIGEVGLTAQPVAYLQSLAARHLEQQLPGMMIRQIVRLVSKAQLNQSFRQKDKAAVMNLFTNLYSVISERADTRSWESLPAIAHYGMTGVLAGEYQLRGGRNGELMVPVTVKAGKITLVMISDIGTNYSSYVYQF